MELRGIEIFHHSRWGLELPRKSGGVMLNDRRLVFR